MHHIVVTFCILLQLIKIIMIIKIITIIKIIIIVIIIIIIVIIIIIIIIITAYHCVIPPPGGETMELQQHTHTHTRTEDTYTYIYIYTVYTVMSAQRMTQTSVAVWNFAVLYCISSRQPGRTHS